MTAADPDGWRAVPRWVRLVLLVDLAGFGVGSATHLVDMAVGGLTPYPDLPLAVNLFWTTLAVLDPVVVLLLLRRPLAGLLLGALVLVVDLPVNLYAQLVLADPGTAATGGLWRLAGFAVFFLGTLVPVARQARRRRRRVCEEEVPA